MVVPTIVITFQVLVGYVAVTVNSVHVHVPPV